MTTFQDARHFPLEHRTDYAAAVAGFRGPDPMPFNWALDWFDGELASNPESRDRPALWIIETATEFEAKLSFKELSCRSNRVANFLRALGLRRGDQVEIEAAVLLTHLRGYTALAEQLAPDQLLERLDQYLEVIVEAVRAERGDVLKFIGDGVLSIFPVEAGGREEACARARRALEAASRKAADIDDLRFVGCLHIGPVTYGNVGSADRLDFTVVGPTVNLISRLEAVAKSMNQSAVCSREVAAFFPADTIRPLGNFVLQGIPNEQTIFSLVPLHTHFGE